MRKIAQERLYRRATIIRAVWGAAQFVHVNEGAVNAVLSSLYDMDARDRLGPCASAARAVPFVLAQARADGFAEECFRGDTINYLGAALGVTCCLCLAIEKQVTEYEGGWYVEDDFARFVCPEYLAVTGLGGGARLTGQPLCIKCRRQVANKDQKLFGWGRHRLSDEDCAVILAWLVGQDSFRARVLANADNARLLRFDPRKSAKMRTAA